MRVKYNGRMIAPSAVASALLCTLCGFLIGRLSIGPKPGEHSTAPECVTRPAQVGGKARLLEERVAEVWRDGSGRRPNTWDWDAFAKWSGLYENRPPLAPGNSGTSRYVLQPYQVLSAYPRILVFPNFIDAERAELFIRLAQPAMTKSWLALRKGETEDGQRDVRTSNGAFVASRADATGALAWIEERIAEITGLPADHGEPFNVLRYEVGQHYNAHHDVFKPEDFGPQENNRVATVLLYLRAPEVGGETIFPLEGEHGAANMAGYNYKTCDRGYLYKPRPGDAVLFWSVGPDGKFDERSLHGGCPVRNGTKWVATKWVREKSLYRRARP